MSLRDRTARAAACDDDLTRLSASIAEIYRDELGFAGVRVEDSLFRLGGTSLDAVRVVRRLERLHGVRVPVADLYHHGSPAALAARLVDLRRTSSVPRRGISARARRRGATFSLAPSQLGIYRADRATGGLGLFNNVVRLRFDGDVDPHCLRGAVDDVVARQSALRIVFSDRPGGPVQRVTDEPARVHEVDLRGRSSEAVRRLARREYLTGFDLHSEPGIRFVLVRTGERAWELVCTAHHVVFDGLSRQVLISDLARAYTVRLGADADAAPEPLDEDFGDYVQWQVEALQGDPLEDALAALDETLRGPAASVLPGPTVDAPAFASRMEQVGLPAATVTALDSAAATHDVSLFVAAATAVMTFARRRSGRARQVLAVQAANRGRVGEELIGCFSSMLCVAADLGESPPGGTVNPAAALHAVRDGLATALRHEELPLDHALAVLAGRGVDLAASGRLPEIGLVLQPAVPARTALPGGALLAEPVLQDGDSIDPTSFPLVLELSAGPEGLGGAVHRLLRHWPAGSFATALEELTAAFDEVAGTPVDSVAARAEPPRPVAAADPDATDGAR